MQKTVSLSLFFLLCISLGAQTPIGVKHTKVSVDTSFSVDKVYNKITGEKVSPEMFQKLLAINPKLILEPVIDKKGEIIKYLYDPQNLKIRVYKPGKTSLVEGFSFPDYNLKTVDGKTMDFNDLKGKMVILRFEMEADSFRFKKHEIAGMDQKINETNRNTEIEAIIIFNANKDEINRGFDLENSNFKLIPNGGNILRQLNVNRFPYTVVLNKEGVVMAVFKYSDEMNILELLNKA
ncbi:peroxiredoxin family protein [Gaetbulibacter aestuarii]|uniref:Redoxin domain-containing protein n=1 Tax=Gaetbulibacter aestuarii TaxID=1502358 RepID=A0ABW7MV32_9FLAO